MICAQTLVDELEQRSLLFFVGVPDSLLQPLCSVLEALPPDRHCITANEGNAVGLAAGYFLATRSPGVVYLQNSGLGNAVNPLLSLADPDVYAIPMLLIIGWRGRPGTPDEPQHAKQGRVTLESLEAMEIPTFIMDADSNVPSLLDSACQAMAIRSGPAALVVCKDALLPMRADGRISEERYSLGREASLHRVISRLPDEAAIISTTGHISRELYEYRQATLYTARDFLTVGSMGHASSIGLGVALAQPDRKVVCLDGDGALLMHLGALPIIGAQQVKNMIHIVFNNGAHDSVGGQPTAGFSCDFRRIALDSGYALAYYAETIEEIDAALKEALCSNGPAFLEIRVRRGARKDLGRPQTSPRYNRDAFMAHMEKQTCTGE